MTKPHEETWSVDWDEHGGYDCMSSAHSLRVDGHPFTTMAVFNCQSQPRHHEDVTQGARAQLAEQAPAMARLLLSLMPKVEPGADAHCGVCFVSDEHAVDCTLITVLRAAGVIE